MALLMLKMTETVWCLLNEGHSMIAMHLVRCILMNKNVSEDVYVDDEVVVVYHLEDDEDVKLKSKIFMSKLDCLTLMFSTLMMCFKDVLIDDDAQ